MKILEKKSVDVNFTESLLRMAADDVEGISYLLCLISVFLNTLLTRNMHFSMSIFRRGYLFLNSFFSAW